MTDSNKKPTRVPSVIMGLCGPDDEVCLEVGGSRLMQLLPGVVRDPGIFCPLSATFLSTLSSSCFNTSLSQDGSWNSRYHGRGLGWTKKNDEGWRGLSAESNPFQQEGQKLSQTPHPAA